MIRSLPSLDYSTQFSVQRSFDLLANVSLKLSTLSRINRGSDDPAGLIAMDLLSRDLSALESAARSADRTVAFTRVADSALHNVDGLLNDIESKIVAAANPTLSPEELGALQLEVDASLDALNRLGQTTFAGRPVFGQSATFLTGPDPTDRLRKTLDLAAVDDSLGSDAGILADLRSGGSASITGGDLEAAQSIVAGARNQITSLRAEVGAFERTAVESTRRIVSDAAVHVSAARSAIRDVDVAAEASLLTRDIVLAQTSVLTSRMLIQQRRITASLLTDLFG